MSASAATALLSTQMMEDGENGEARRRISVCLLLFLQTQQ